MLSIMPIILCKTKCSQPLIQFKLFYYFNCCINCFQRPGSRESQNSTKSGTSCKTTLTQASLPDGGGVGDGFAAVSSSSVVVVVDGGADANSSSSAVAAATTTAADAGSSRVPQQANRDTNNDIGSIPIRLAVRFCCFGFLPKEIY